MTDETDETATDIATLVEHNPAVVLLDGDKRQALFAHIESELVAFVPDLSTSAGREDVRRFAAKITKTKTAADKAGLDMTADARAKIAQVNAARNEVKERLTALAERARRPLTEWEEAEEKRLAACEDALKQLTAAGVVPIDATSESVTRALAWAEAYHLDPALFGSMLEAATKARAHTIELLRAALARIEQQEKERAELDALRAEAERRRREDEERAKAQAAEEEARRREREAQEAAQRAEQERVEREKAEVERQAREAAEAEERAARAAKDAEERAARAAAEAEERARREAEAAAQREREKAERAHQEQLRIERQRAEAAERAAREAEEARQREEAERAAAAEAERRRREKAEADANHRKRCKAEVKAVLLTTGITEDEAKAIVLMIVSGEVPRVTLDWAAEPKVKQAEDVLKALL